METAENTAAPGTIELHGKTFWIDALGSYVPESVVSPEDKLKDQTVRKIIGHARELSAQVSRFKAHTADDITGLMEILAEQYGTTLGGKKGNILMVSFDGSLKVEVQVADLIEFGPELQLAKRLLDECLAEWSASSRDELQAVVTRAFSVEKQGKINKSELFMLMRVQIEDPRWQSAMKAIKDSIRVLGSKTYYRFFERASTDEGWGQWTAIPVDLARA